MGEWDQNESWGDWLGKGVEWIQVAQVRDQWLAVVNMEMKLRVLAPRNEVV
jgi:hypothetical protein